MTARLNFLMAVVVVVGCVAAAIVIGVGAQPQPEIAEELVVRVEVRQNGRFRLLGAQPEMEVEELHAGRWDAPWSTLEPDLKQLRGEIEALVGTRHDAPWRDEEGSLAVSVDLRMDPGVPALWLQVFRSVFAHPRIRAAKIDLRAGDADLLPIRDPAHVAVGGVTPERVRYQEVRLHAKPSGTPRSVDVSFLARVVWEPYFIEETGAERPPPTKEMFPYPAGAMAASDRREALDKARLVIERELDRAHELEYVLAVKVLPPAAPASVRIDEAVELLRMAFAVLREPGRVFLVDPPDVWWETIRKR